MIGSRPDLAYVIGKLSQHFQSPSEFRWSAAKRVLRCVNGTKDFGILYDGLHPSQLIRYSDSDWARCKNSRNSTSGSVFAASGGAISWRSKKQTCVALSSCEAEYIAACLATRESIWLSRLLSDLYNQSEPQTVTIGVDNDGAIDTG